MRFHSVRILFRLVNNLVMQCCLWQFGDLSAITAVYLCRNDENRNTKRRLQWTTVLCRILFPLVNNLVVQCSMRGHRDLPGNTVVQLRRNANTKRRV